MAGSRLERLGSIFGRVTALIKCGALKRENKPLWYEIYQVFPPLTEPSFANVRTQPPIREIFYPEDEIRAKFHQKMFRMLPPEDLMNETTTDVTRRAIDLTNKLMLENDQLPVEKAVDKAIEIFKNEGLFVVRRSVRTTRTDSVRQETYRDKPSDAENIETTIKTISEKRIDIASLWKKEKNDE